MSTLKLRGVVMSTLNERLIQLKNERGLLQKDIARDVGLALRTYQYYETGQRKIGRASCRERV